MEYLAFVFGLFGFFAFLQSTEQKRRMDKLESALAALKGTSYHEARKDLVRAAKSYIGQSVELTFKEDRMDADVITYGNTKHGTNTITDVDDEWMLVHISSPNGDKDKLIRTEAIQTISPKK